MPAKAKSVNLTAMRPDLLSFFDVELNPGVDPESISPLGKVIHWKCPEGHVWSSEVLYQANRKWKCPECLSIGYLFPELADELDTIQPDHRVSRLVLASSVKNAAWIGKKCGHRWEMNIRARTRDGYGCPFCSSQRVLAGYNDVATTHPHLAALWSPNNKLTPQEVSYGSRKPLLWVSPGCGHEWERTLNHLIKLDGIRCPVCFPFMGGGKPSYRETVLFDWVKERYPEAEQGRRDLLRGRTEVDIYLPSLNLAIEFNGAYWHSDKMLLKSKKMTAAEYHSEKLEMGHAAGIEILFVWELDWVKRQDLLLSELESYIESRSQDATAPVPAIFRKMTASD